MDIISENELVALFDQLVSEGVIVYGPHTKHVVEDEGYPIEFRICPALSTKPHTISSPNTSYSHTARAGPGSDMFIPDQRLILCQLNNTHDLALNLFCVDRPQLLMLTTDSHKRQHEPLNADDLTAALEVLRKWSGWYVIFNCGEKGGCSRVHKHLQGLRGPPFAFDVLVAEVKEPQGKVPFKFFLHQFESDSRGIELEIVLEKYQELLEQSREVLHLGQDEYVPHNVVLWERSIIVIPRRSGVHEGASANTGGMLGSIWVTDQAEVDKWLKAGCANVLRGLGVPR